MNMESICRNIIFGEIMVGRTVFFHHGMILTLSQVKMMVTQLQESLRLAKVQNKYFHVDKNLDTTLLCKILALMQLARQFTVNMNAILSSTMVSFLKLGLAATGVEMISPST